MRTRRLAAIALLAAILPASLRPQSPLVACAPAPHEGESVRIAGESALIVWDPKAQTEHFVRRAGFETTARDFGFLVPTPTPPDLGEVDDGVFGLAARLTEPRHVRETVVKTVFGFSQPSRAGLKDSAPPAGAVTAAAPVEVLHQQEVAGFDASVLRADDPKALADWLVDHGYEARPALAEWLRWYTDHAWIITAFKLTKDRPGDRGLEARAVRMSFHADRPFYPYREPEDMRKPGEGSRLLRVFFLADRKFEGTLGDSGAWPASTAWADDVSGRVAGLTASLKLAKAPDGARYLTEFEDTSSPRPGTDEVYFRPASDASTRERPPIVTVDTEVRPWPGPWGAAGLLALGVAVVGVVALRGRRRPASP